MTTLEQKIASALADDSITSTVLAELITEVETTIVADDKAAETQRKQAAWPPPKPSMEVRAVQELDGVFLYFCVECGRLLLTAMASGCALASWAAGTAPRIGHKHRNAVSIVTV